MDETLVAFAHPVFPEGVDSYQPGPVFLTELKTLVPSSWAIVRSGIWLAVQNGLGHPGQGFKIHISTTRACAVSALRAVVPVCVEHEVDFKVAGDTALLNLINGKRYPREGAGKFITIYPRTREHFTHIIENIYQRTRNLALVGPYILSDRRYKDSPVIYYRYGGFQRRSRVALDGSHELLVEAPDGALETDNRRPYFCMPEWVEDPFGPAAGVPDELESTLAGRYQIDGVLTFSNAGGVYSAIDRQTRERVVIKEARPHTHQWRGDKRVIDACDLLQHEWEILRRLAHLDVVPRAIDHFVEWEHSFLVEEYLDGPSFWEYWADATNLLAPYVHRPGRIENFVPKFQALAAAIIDSVAAVHDAGVVLGDLSPKNVLVHPDLRISFIDFESAVTRDDHELATLAVSWHTPGYRDPRRGDQERLSEKDDWYAVGMLLYAAVVPVQGFFLLDPEARDRFIKEFVRLGVPEEAHWIINALLNGNPAEGKAILYQWRSLSPVTIIADRSLSEADHAVADSSDQLQLAEVA